MSAKEIILMVQKLDDKEFTVLARMIVKELEKRGDQIKETSKSKNLFY